MDSLVECVPNFSTSDEGVIDKISSAISSCPDVHLLHVDPDTDYNRVVFTFVGTPQGIGEAAFEAIRVATADVDMRLHSGQHPRIGTTDVCPFIPLQNSSVEECVAIAEKLAKRVGEELELPVYLYGKAAQNAERQVLFNIRRGEYEGLSQKLKDPNWIPDFGPRLFSAQSGAVVIGVRDILIAYNINLKSSDTSIAMRIAKLVRESGTLTKEDGKMKRIPGKFMGIQAMGVKLVKSERELSQVSTNILDYQDKTGIHTIYEGVKVEADRLGTRVTGSQLVGLIPLQAVLHAASQIDPDLDDREAQILCVERYLGLHDLKNDPLRGRILDYLLEKMS